ncbi:hypothetical protein LTR94_026925, partial [Friedmanniomyces endolithicus]
KRDAPPSLHAIVYRDLALDADQGVRIEAIEARFAPRRIALEARVQAANRELAAAISASDGDVSVVRPAVDHFHDAIGELQQATITHISEMRMAQAAAILGVSIKTVSRVLNNERYVGAETRARVQAAVEALHFRPNLAARALAGRRAFQIALVCDNPSPSYVYAMQTGIRDRCEADGVRMIAQPYDRASAHLVEQIEALVDTSRMDGIVLTPPVSDDAA